MQQSIATIERAGAAKAAAIGHSPTGEWWRAVVRLPGERRARTSGWFATAEEAQEIATSAVRIHAR